VGIGVGVLVVEGDNSFAEHPNIRITRNRIKSPFIILINLKNINNLHNQTN